MPVQHLKDRVETERRMLAAGEKPKSRFSSPLQRTAARALAAFFALMLVLTLVSRAADGVTVARVQTQRARTGVLTQRVTVSGSLQPLGDLPLTLLGGITVTSILAKEGDRVLAGDPLMELDLGDLRSQIAALEEKLRIVELRLSAATSGTTRTSMDAVLAAEQALADAQEDYARLLEKQDRSGDRRLEDIDDAQAEVDKAGEDLDRAVGQAKKRLVEAAEDKVEAAEKALETVQEAAQSAIEAAEDRLTSAQDAKKSSNKNYYQSVENLSKLEDRLKEARAELQALIDAGAEQDKIDAAQAEVDSLREAVDAAQWSMGTYDYGGDLAVRRAKDDLAKVQERQAEKVKEAEADLQAVKDELEEVKKRTDFSEESEVLAAQSALEGAEKALRSAQRAAEDGVFTDEEALFGAERAVENAQRALDNAQRKAEEEAQDAALSDEKSGRQAEIERLGYLAEGRALRETLSDLRAVAAAGGMLTAPVDGTVKSILAEPGVTQSGGRLALLGRTDQGFTFQGTLPQEEAEELAVGDEGSLTFTKDGKSVDLEVVVSGLGAADDKGLVTVTAALPEGAWPDGAAASLEVSKRSEQYPTTLPLSALRGEGEDQFVLVLQERRTVMGTEQTVVKLPVRVKDQDSQNMAVEGAFIGTEAVVVSANKPIEEGDRVRLETPEE